LGRFVHLLFNSIAFFEREAPVFMVASGLEPFAKPSISWMA
jgi:hypothetical protein